MKRLISSVLLACAVLAATAARVDTVTVATSNLETPMNIIVITPDAAAEGKHFPTAYVLHGYYGDYCDWSVHQPRIKDAADLYGMVIVHPDGRDSWYLDAPMNPNVKMESFFINDLVPFVDANYPTIPDASKRAITGLSMGGHGALFLAFRHPDVFGNAGSMSGGVDLRPFPGNWGLAGIIGSQEDFPERWEQYSVINLVKDLKPGEINIMFDCGTDDVFAQVNENLHKAMLDAKIPHDYTSRPGGHTWEYWNNSILHHLLYFNEAFNR